MSFDYMKWLMDPFILMFVTVASGLMFGKIKFGKFNFGTSGALFTGLPIGWFMMNLAKGIGEDDKAYKSASSLVKAGVVDKGFFTLFLVLFVVAVGLLAAKDIDVVLKKYGAKFIIMGFVVTLVGAGATYGMTFFSKDSNPYEISGVYTGALTSSPGLAAAIETARKHATNEVAKFDTMTAEEKEKFFAILGEDLDPNTTTALTDDQKAQFIKNAEAGIGVGHAIGYPFGVLIVIIAMNFFPKIFRIDIEKEKLEFKREMADAKAGKTAKEIPEVSFDMIGFVFACFFGYTIGLITIDLSFIGLGNFSLGATGGALIGSLIVGYIGKIGFINFRMNSKILGVIREVSLAFFLAIVGLRYGFAVVDALAGPGAFLGLVALVVGVVAMMVGYVIGRYVFKINWIMLSGAICGGMTSTPGLGAAVEAVGSDDPAAGYGATYPFALLGMVIFTIILHSLPM
jgi:putative transport protein